MARAEAIRSETGFEDVVFTDDPAFIQETPLYLAHSMKRVYPAQSLTDIWDKVKDISAQYNVVLLHPEVPGAAKRNPELAVLDQAAANERVFQDVRLVRVPKARFLEICRQRGLLPPHKGLISWRRLFGRGLSQFLEGLDKTAQRG